MRQPPPDDPTRPVRSAGPRRSRRRRRRGGERAQPPPPAPLVPTVSGLAEPSPASDVLTSAETAEMKQHLSFLRRYKEAFRLKLNAAEDLLVNGQREPRERGVCRHLLGKVDRTVIEQAIGREPLKSDAAARAHMLAGAIRLTADVGVLLAYLEALAHVRSHTEAAQAFAEVVERIDFAALSATRLGRLLDVLVTTFVDHERVQVLFSLLAGATFRRALDAAAADLPPGVAAAVTPLRAVYRRLLEGALDTEAPALLATGLEQVLSAPDPVLRGYAESLRVGLLELALDPAVPAALADRAVGVLLSTLPRSGHIYARLALRRTAQLLGRHADDRARGVLEELHRAQPGLRTAERWLAALGGHRLGRVALTGELPARGRLAPGFWLDGQRPVWVRTASTPAAERLASEFRLQAELALPGVAPVVDHGVAGGIPYVAVVGPGRPLTFDGSPPFDLRTGLSLAAAAARALRALALAGLALPDAAPERFLHVTAPAPATVLADLDGVSPAEPPVAHAAHALLATSLIRQLLPATAVTHAMRQVTTAIEGTRELVELIGVLDRALLRGPDRA